MNDKISRRDFLKLCGVGMAGLALRPQRLFSQDLDVGMMARVGTRSVSVHSMPWDESRILYQRYRDELLNIYYEEVSEHGPGYNPVWYRVWGGYIHSAHLQRVKMQLNPVLAQVSERGVLAEVSVPYTQSYLKLPKGQWQQVYRLYYQSTHWLVGVEEGPDGDAWYRIRDELGDMEYLARAEHFRPIPPEEMAPISPDVPMEKKRIEVSLAKQELIAYENDQVVLKTRISSGIPQREAPPGEVSTNTPTGEFNVMSKMPSKHMGEATLTDDLEAYVLPGVPWVTFFAKDGVALHGTYWHTNFGMTMSHGCVNMRTEEARWIYRWTLPIALPDEIEKRGFGTRVIVR